jgi:tetratricopeptide (TPR) repeat protein
VKKVIILSFILIAWCAVAVAVPVKPSQELFDEGLQALRNSEYQKAIDAFQACLWSLPENDPHLDSIYDNLGLAYVNAGQIDEGIRYLQKSIVANPDYALSYAHLGSVYRMKGDFSDAIMTLLVAIKIAPDFAPAHDEIWRTYGQIGRYYGFTREVILREVYHIESLFQVDPQYETGDPDILRELKFLIALNSEIEKIGDESKKESAAFHGKLNDEGLISNFFAVFDEVPQLPEDKITREEKEKYFTQARDRILRLAKQ